MKKIGLLFVLFTLFYVSPFMAQDVTTVEAKNSEISDNLDLDAVASVFGEAKDLEDFEKKLNDPELKISNLDLNNDGEVDYLRVVETSDKDAHVVVIQSVIGKDEYQDVATIDVVKDTSGDTKVQVVGDVYMYGPDYIIQPVYVHPPIIFTFFWGPLYRPWHSPFYWGYYPPYYRPWRPYPPYRYHQNIHVHVNVNNTYNRTNVRVNKNSVNMQKRVSKNDYARKHPDRSYQKRAVNNKSKQRPQHNTKPANVNKEKAKPATRPVDKNWHPKTKPATQPAISHKNKPSTKPAKNPSKKPATTHKKPSTHKPAAKPATTHKKTPTHKPANRPTPRPVKRGGRR